MVFLIPFDAQGHIPSARALDYHTQEAADEIMNCLPVPDRLLMVCEISGSS